MGVIVFPGKAYVPVAQLPASVALFLLSPEMLAAAGAKEIRGKWHVRIENARILAEDPEILKYADRAGVDKRTIGMHLKQNPPSTFGADGGMVRVGGRKGTLPVGKGWALLFARKGIAARFDRAAEIAAGTTKRRRKLSQARTAPAKAQASKAQATAAPAAPKRAPKVKAGK